MSGVWRVLQTWGLGLHTSYARLFSPDPTTAARSAGCTAACATPAAPGYRRRVVSGRVWLSALASGRATWGVEAAVAPRAGNNQQWRTIGALNALTGQVNYLDGYIVGRQQVIQFYSHLARAYPKGGLASM